MNRTTLQRITTLRRREAASLLKAGHYPGAYYLVGYSVECALKACVAKQVRRYDFPNKRVANEAFTHDLERLLKVAGLGPTLERDLDANPALELNWAVVKDWTAAARYDDAITAAQARDLYSACTARKNGVLAWIRQRW